MDIFNASVTPRPDVLYRCVLTAAPPPRLFRKSVVQSANHAAMFFLFTLLYKLASAERRYYPYPDVSEKTAREIKNAFSFPVTPHTNDGIVPTMSQMYGELLDVVVSDHLDVVGRFANAGNEHRNDWLPSGSGFNEKRFQRIWRHIAFGIAQSGDMNVV